MKEGGGKKNTDLEIFTDPVEKVTKNLEPPFAARALTRWSALLRHPDHPSRFLATARSLNCELETAKYLNQKGLVFEAISNRVRWIFFGFFPS